MSKQIKWLITYVFTIWTVAVITAIIFAPLGFKFLYGAILPLGPYLIYLFWADPE